MLPKSSKFPTRQQFLSFRSKAKQSITPHLRIMTHPHAPSRLSVIVPIKVNKRATTRNSFKRLVYDIVWKTLRTKNLDCVIIFKPLALTKGPSSQELLAHELSQATALL